MRDVAVPDAVATDLPHVIAGQPLPLAEEYVRVFEAWWREHNDGPLPVGTRMNAVLYNQAVDWWNGLGEEEARPTPLPSPPKT